MMNKNLACQMPNLARLWHFLTMADRAANPLIKVDQLSKTFSKHDLKMPKCQFGTLLAFPNAGR